jgi:methylmalonyl-CoA mutase C-terminal domain/subunit
MSRPIKVLLSKIGLDGHDAGVIAVATALRDEGMEVIYTGPWQTPETIVQTAIQEDVDVIGVSSLASDHVLVPRIMKLLEEKSAHEIMVIVGGIIPKEDAVVLKSCGVAEVFGPGAQLSEIGAFIRQRCRGEN